MQSCNTLPLELNPTSLTPQEAWVAWPHSFFHTPQLRASSGLSCSSHISFISFPSQSSSLTPESCEFLFPLPRISFPSCSFCWFFLNFWISFSSFPFLAFPVTYVSNLLQPIHVSLPHYPFFILCTSQSKMPHLSTCILPVFPCRMSASRGQTLCLSCLSLHSLPSLCRFL